MKTPVTRERLKVHWTYSWWKYVIAIAVVVFATDLLYTTTAYRPPEDKVIELYCVGIGNQESLDAYLQGINEKAEMGMEKVSSRLILQEEYYANMSLTVFLAAQEGDIYILPRENFRAYTTEGGFRPLEDEEALVSLFREDDLAMGWRRVDGERHLYGIPASLLPGLKRFLYLTDDAMICVVVANGNDENVIRFLTLLAEDNLTAPENLPSEVTIGDIMP